MNQRRAFRFFRDYEGLILYGLTGLTVAVSMLVYGATKLRSSGGLFDEWRPVFGSGFSIGLLMFVIALLVVNRRWLGIGGVLAAYSIALLLGLSPTRKVPLQLDEFLVIANTLTLLFLSVCHHQDLWKS